MITQPLSMAHDMGGKQNGRAAIPLGPDQPLQMFLIDRIEPGKRLIQHDQFGLRGR